MELCVVQQHECGQLACEKRARGWRVFWRTRTVSGRDNGQTHAFVFGLRKKTHLDRAADRNRSRLNDFYGLDSVVQTIVRSVLEMR